MPKANELTVSDRFEIFEQLNLHQHCIDNDGSLESVRKYQDLYWPEAKFTVHDLRHITFEGREGLKRLYDYAHSVFPPAQMAARPRHVRDRGGRRRGEGRVAVGCVLEG
jgi:hypothetical protein